MNPLLFPPALLKRALEDLSAIGHAARQLDDIQPAVLERLDAIGAQLERLRRDVGRFSQLSAVRAQVELLREAVEPLDGKLDQLRGDVEPLQHLAEVRAGIEPLDDDLHRVRESIDTIEPLVKGIESRIESIDGRLSEMSADLAPVGDLAEKMPGVERR